MKFRRLTNREIILVVVALLFFICSEAWIWLIRPMLEEWTNVNNEIEAKELLLTKYSRIISRKDVLLAKNQHLTSLATNRESAEEETASLLGYVERSAGNSVSIINLRPLSVSHTEYYDKYRIEVEVEAAMNDLVKFLYKLESENKPIRIDKFRLSTGKSSSNLLRARMIVTKATIDENAFSTYENP